jgi:hypothetical protein
VCTGAWRRDFLDASHSLLSSRPGFRAAERCVE